MIKMVIYSPTIIGELSSSLRLIAKTYSYNKEITKLTQTYFFMLSLHTRYQLLIISSQNPMSHCIKKEKKSNGKSNFPWSKKIAMIQHQEHDLPQTHSKKKASPGSKVEKKCLHQDFYLQVQTDTIKYQISQDTHPDSVMVSSSVSSLSTPLPRKEICSKTQLWTLPTADECCVCV